LAYYPDRSSPLLVKIGSQRVAGAEASISRRPGGDRRMLLVVMDEQAGVESVVRAVVIYGYGSRYRHWELQAAALLKAVWWGMRLASLLTHLFFFLHRATSK